MISCSLLYKKHNNIFAHFWPEQTEGSMIHARSVQTVGKFKVTEVLPYSAPANDIVFMNAVRWVNVSEGPAKELVYVSMLLIKKSTLNTFILQLQLVIQSSCMTIHPQQLIATTTCIMLEVMKPFASCFHNKNSRWYGNDIVRAHLYTCTQSHMSILTISLCTLYVHAWRLINCMELEQITSTKAASPQDKVRSSFVILVEVGNKF